jgi:hypothetical protein
VPDPVITPPAPVVDPAFTRARALVDKLWNDSDVGAKLRTTAKELYPEIVIPEDTITPLMAPVREQLDAYKAEITKLQEERATERAAADDARARVNMEHAVNAARDKFHLTDAGLDMMVERMKASQSYDAEAAAAWAASKNPPPPAAKPAWAPQDMNLFGSKEADEKLALLHRDPERYRDMEIEAMLADPEGYVAEDLRMRGLAA